MLVVELKLNLNYRRQQINSAIDLCKKYDNDLTFIWVKDENIPYNFADYFDDNLQHCKIINVNRPGISIHAVIKKHQYIRSLKTIFARIHEKRVLAKYKYYSKSSEWCGESEKAIRNKGNVFVDYMLPQSDVFFCDYNKDYWKKIREAEVCIIKYWGYSNGICFIMMQVLNQIHTLLRINPNYKFVVDLKSVENAYHNHMDGDINPWDEFFIQPDQMNLEKNKKQKVVPSDFSDIEYWLDYNVMNSSREKIREYNVFFNKYIKLNARLQKIYEDELRRIKMSASGKILGIKVRSTDYQPEIIPSGHFVQATAVEVIEYAKDIIQHYGYKNIFLATETQEVLDLFKKAFPDLLYYDCKLIEHYSGGIAVEASARAAGKIQSGIDYIITTYLLASCDSLVASKNGGAAMAVVINGGKYENIWCIDKGFHV